MKGKVLIAGLMVLLSLSLLGCGGDSVSIGESGGTPGSTGSDVTGVLIRSVSVAREDGPDIDVFSSDTTNPITRDDITLNIAAERRNQSGLSEPFPATVEECTITYLKAIEDPSSPIIPSLTIFPNCILTESAAGAPNTCVVTLIDVQRKRDFWNALNQGLNLPAEYPTHYVARYVCKYRSNFDEYGTFPVEYDFWLGDF